MAIRLLSSENINGNLVVTGEVQIPASADGNKFTITSSATSNHNIIEMGQLGSDGFLDVSAAGGNIVSHLSGYTGYATYFLSNVGIGTDNPYAFDTAATKLHVKNEGSSGSLSEVARFQGSSDGDGSGGTIRLGTSNDRGIYFEGGRTGSVPYGKIGTTEYDGAKTVAITLDNSGNATFTGTVTGTIARFDTLNNNANSANIIYRSGTDTIVGGGSPPNKIYVQDGGNVGIGVTSPNATLHVDGGVHFGTDSAVLNPTDGEVLIETVAGGTPRLKMYVYGSSVFDIHSDGTTANIGWGSGADREVNFQNTGAGNIKVGIGTGAPEQVLHVEGRGIFDGGGSSDILQIRNDSGGGVFGMTSNLFALDLASTSNFRIRQGSSVPLYLKSNGNLGIGTTAALATLDLGINGGQKFYVYANGNIRSGMGIDLSGSPRELSIFHTSSNNIDGDISFGLRNETSGQYVERMRVQGDGNVGIGISTPHAKLQVNSAVNSFAGHFGQGQNNTNGNYGGISLGYAEDGNASYRKVAIVAQATGDGAARQNLLFLVDSASDGNSADINDNKMILNYDGAIKIGNGSNIAINTNGGHFHAAGPAGFTMRQYQYYVDIPNGSTIDLFKNSSAYSDIQMTKISIVMYHSSRTYFVGMGTVGGYALALTGAGIGQANGGLTASVVSSGIRKLQIANNSGFQATARIFIEIMADSGVIVLNGSISAPY